MRTISVIATLFAIASIQGCGSDDKPNPTAAAVTALDVAPEKRTDAHKAAMKKFTELSENDKTTEMTKYVKEQLKSEAGAKNLVPEKKWTEIKDLKDADLDKIVAPIVRVILGRFAADGKPATPAAAAAAAAAASGAASPAEPTV